MYAIISLAGKQYRVEKGTKLTVDRLDAEEGKNITVNEVLFVSDGKKVSVGTPVLDKASVILKVLEHGQDKKIRVATYKAKSRYRKVKGHRQQITSVEVTDIKA